MPITQGDFTPSQLTAAIMRADKMWSDDMLKADYEANTDVWKAINAEQNANVDILQSNEKDRDVKVHWVNLCGEAAEDADADDCDLEGAEFGSDSQTYALGIHKQFKVSIDEMTFRTNDYNVEEIVAKAILKADKALADAVAGSAVARIESFKGVNVVTDGVGTVNGVTTETDVAAADWNERLFAYLYRVGIQNKLSNPYLVSGTNLFEDRLVAMLSEANANGKGDAALFKMMRTYFDLFNIDPANSPNLKTYLINRGSIAFAGKHWYGAVPTKYMQQHRYSVAMRNLPGYRMDVFYENKCSGVTIKHNMKFKLSYDYFLNPTGCEGTRTGVLAFNKTA